MRGDANSRASVLLLALHGCGDPMPRGAAERSATEMIEAIARIGWSDGDVVRVVELSPDPIAPGDTLTLALELDGGTARELELVLWPPRVGGRELVIGTGVGPDDARRPDDPRTVRTRIRLEPGVTTDAALALPMPWHPRTAMLTLERVDGVRASEGPRTRDGLGIAGLVRVDTVPTAVTAARAELAPTIDGVLDDAVWSVAARTVLLDSLEGEPSEPASELQLAWDDDALYAAARFDDEDVWSEYEAQDDPLWKQEAFELFVLGAADRKRYLELQVSPRGVTFDARFERYRQGDEAWDGTWRAAVAVDGTAAKRDDRDRGWSVELAVPWSDICTHTAAACPPRAGTVLRINAFRLDRPRRGNPIAQSLSPTRVTDFHAPENAAKVELAP